MAGIILSGILDGSSVLVSVITIVTAAAVFFSVYKKGTSQEWRDVADARLAAIGDRDSEIVGLRSDQAKEVERSHAIEIELRGRISSLEATVEHQKVEIATLKRHDVTSVATLVQTLSDRLDGQLSALLTQSEAATQALLALSQSLEKK